jgi:hypothetical protein
MGKVQINLSLVPGCFSSAHNPDGVVVLSRIGMDDQQQDDAGSHARGVPPFLIVFKTIKSKQHKRIRPDQCRILERDLVLDQIAPCLFGIPQ